ncbi:hypothetical protein AK95_04385 [Paenibacillus sp. LC231]|uniref:hypothetical protein n=1 Tax=Paenibacillus sp. LC231 TaxID=1120679 RepID=UPI0008DD5FC5|nr:hypothetical protein [Paenibacillus sp. LC231]OIB02154.1 hypothetical protein AK95_04385 [Paenibacillus sp. LC231]
MLKKIALTAVAVTMISGMFITINSLANPADSSSISKSSVTEEVETDSIDSLDTELSTAEETKGMPLSDLRDIEEIVTHHGNFVRTDEQTIFDESQIAREKKNIGPKTMQIILDYGIFLRKEEES